MAGDVFFASFDGVRSITTQSTTGNLIDVVCIINDRASSHPLAFTGAVEDLKGDAVDALEEFLDVVNGLYIVELANRKIEPDLDFPLANEDVIPRDSHQLLLRVYTEAGDFILVLSTDAFL